MQTAKATVLFLILLVHVSNNYMCCRWNFKISSVTGWAGRSYLYPLFMVIVKAAIKVSRQLGRVDDLRQAL